MPSLREDLLSDVERMYAEEMHRLVDAANQMNPAALEERGPKRWFHALGGRYFSLELHATVRPPWFMKLNKTLKTYRRSVVLFVIHYYTEEPYAETWMQDRAPLTRVAACTDAVVSVDGKIAALYEIDSSLGTHQYALNHSDNHTIRQFLQDKAVQLKRQPPARLLRERYGVVAEGFKLAEANHPLPVELEPFAWMYEEADNAWQLQMDALRARGLDHPMREAGDE